MSMKVKKSNPVSHSISSLKEVSDGFESIFSLLKMI